MPFPHRLNSRAFGNKQETEALHYLKAKGLRLLSRNYNSRYGEIDLIMADASTLVFIEVRYRRNSQFGSAVSSVTRCKQTKIRLTAALFLQANPKLQHSYCRFDVIGLSQQPNSSKLRVEWIKNAFS